VNRNDALRDALQNKVAFVKVNANTKAGGPVAMSYGASGVPFFVLADAAGKPLASWGGYIGPKRFTEQLEKALARAR
jgi:thioredoxin-related protein